MWRNALAQCPGIRNLIAQNSSTRQHDLHHQSSSVSCWADCHVNLSVHESALFTESASQFHVVILTYERMPIITQWFRALATDVVSARSSRSSPRRPPASERLFLPKNVSYRFSFAVHKVRMVLFIFHVHSHHDGNYKRLLLCTVLWLYFLSTLTGVPLPLSFAGTPVSILSSPASKFRAFIL